MKQKLKNIWALLAIAAMSAPVHAAQLSQDWKCTCTIES